MNHSRERESADPKQNRLLAKLPAEDLQALLLNSDVLHLNADQILYRNGDPINAVYFPLDCVMSIIIGVDKNTDVEMGTTGSEGLVGASVGIGVPQSIGVTLVQIPGSAMRIGIADFENELNERPALKEVVQRFIFVLMHQVMYSGACNRAHTMEERCARWLLMTHDRAGRSTFPLTQEYLAYMLGVRRATVNLALGTLRNAGFIQYTRGQITITDRVGLHASSCPCYDAMRDAYDSVIFGSPTALSMSGTVHS